MGRGAFLALPVADPRSAKACLRHRTGCNEILGWSQVAAESAEELKFDLTDLYLTAPAFSRAGAAIGDAVSQATSQLERLGAFWGHDAAGQKFGSSYAPKQAELLQILAVLAGEVQGVSEGINRMAANYGIVENANLAKIRAMEQELR